MTEQIIYNLISHASQYKLKEARIKIKVVCNPNIDFEYNPHKLMCGVIIISVDGKGFPEEEIDKFF